jgi:GT2 family glycosyltransferase
VAFPGIAEKVRSGALKSGFDHYKKVGAAEGRLNQPRYQKALADQALLQRLSAPKQTSETPGPRPTPAGPYIPSGLDALLVSDSGYCLAIGWVDDRAAPLTAVGLALPNEQREMSLKIARCRRADAEAAIGCPPGYLLGFYSFFNLEQNEPPGAGTGALLYCGDEPLAHVPKPNYMAPPMLRDSIFEYLAAARYFGNPAVESFLQLEGGIGEALLGFNRVISGGVTRLAHVERYGPQNRRFIASIVICLYGKPEYLFLQAAMFSAAPGATDYEYVYVSNSPELTETLQREARMAAQLYGLSLTMIFLPGNAGFGAANNAAVSHAQSNRVIMLNPDVFPRDPLWAQRHAALIGELPAEQTRLFGAPLFYDDGSLMHGGMFIETDIGLSIKPNGIVQQKLLRVEHYGKGAPPQTPIYKQSRQVPAVTGAFISADRDWFERLGGFSEEYVFGHYEDADLCLKSWREGGQVWLHNLPMWHLEGKGSTRKPAHEGGSMINRWHFTRTWLATVENGFGGSAPARLAP